MISNRVKKVVKLHFLIFTDLKRDDLVILVNDEVFVKSEFDRSKFRWESVD